MGILDKAGSLETWFLVKQAEKHGFSATAAEIASNIWHESVVRSKERTFFMNRDRVVNNSRAKNEMFHLLLKL